MCSIYCIRYQNIKMAYANKWYVFTHLLNHLGHLIFTLLLSHVLTFRLNVSCNTSNCIHFGTFRHLIVAVSKLVSIHSLIHSLIPSLLPSFLPMDSSPQNENSVIIYSHSSCSKPVQIYVFWSMNTKEHILKNVNKRTVDGHHWLS